MRYQRADPTGGRYIFTVSLDEYRMRHPDRDQAIAQAYLSGAYTTAEI